MDRERFEVNQDKIDAYNAEQARLAEEQSKLAFQAELLTTTVANAVKALIDFQKTFQPRVSVTNQKDFPTSIKTPDVQGVIDSLNSLEKSLSGIKPDDSQILTALATLNQNIQKLPTSFPVFPKPLEAVKVANQPDYKKDFAELQKAVKQIDVKPAVTVKQDKVNLDITPVVKALGEVISAVGGIEIPESPETDLEPLITATKAVQTSIDSLVFPVANYVLPFKTPTGAATQALVNSAGNLVSDNTIFETFDDIKFTNPDLDGNYQTVTFKLGGVTKHVLTMAFDINENVTSIVRT